MLFLSKCNHLRTLAQTSWISIYFPFYDLHEIHTVGGKAVAYLISVHCVCHIARWAIQGKILFLFTSQTGETGFWMMLMLPLIVLPMAVASLRKRISWEVRKGLHYLSVPWGVLLALHAPAMSVIFIVGIPVLLYVLDYVIGSISRTYRIESPTFTRIECGVELVFEHPPGFKSDGTGYVLVNLPWLRSWEWHAFSLFAHATLDNHSCVCMNKSGDWTEALHAMIDRPTALPCWISGPFASPYSSAFNYANIVLVASGIGITPALSLITWHRESERRTNLVWCCRDASLLEFYLADSKTYFSKRAWTLIFYTGKRKFALPAHLPPTVLLFTGRPNFEKVIGELIFGIERLTGLPEHLFQASEQVQQSALEYDKTIHLEGVSAGDRLNVLLRRHRRSEGPERFDAQIEAAYARACATCGLPSSDNADSAQSSRATDPMTPLPRLRDLPSASAPAAPAQVAVTIPRDVQMASQATSEPLAETAISIQSPARVEPAGDSAGHLAAGILLPRTEPHLTALQDGTAMPLSNPSPCVGGSEKLLVDDQFLLEFVGELFPSAFTDEEVPELLSRFSHTSSGRVPLEALKSAIDDVITEVELTKSHLRASSGPGAAMHMRQQAQLAFAPPSKKIPRGDETVAPSAAASRPNKLYEAADGFIGSFQGGGLVDTATGVVEESLEREGTRSMRKRLIEEIGPARLATWQMLYCGGSQPVVDALTEISQSFAISLKVEKFDW
eukprot:CAMPEP_0115850806 /NCGR_PEP_ID=MMETSP0287-20121206/12155_1 /TAXON_ID=412157 /ORGANISM="Chrysochromulina rotalis, Strain UIO044" /LENGTH=729 /DNA_ID=CAMNT_0003304817 /DNA_START=333 /DNA_END=2522 /DNA_ORIENTATION=-